MWVNVVMICTLLMRVDVVVRMGVVERMGVVVVSRLLMRLLVVVHGVTPIRL